MHMKILGSWEYIKPLIHFASCCEENSKIFDGRCILFAVKVLHKESDGTSF